MIITEDSLFKYGVYFNIIKFFKINFPKGIDTEKVEICGDYKLFRFDIYYIIRLYEIYKNVKLNYTYNKDNILTKIESSLGFIYEYDNNGNVVKQIDRLGFIYEYDVFGNFIKYIEPENYTNRKILTFNYEYEYNDRGNITKIIDCNLKDVDDYSGRIQNINYLYDNKDRLIKIYSTCELHKWPINCLIILYNS